jgi:hypothetical protein
MRQLVAGIAFVAVALAAVRPHAAPATPVLVELFTSEGCSSCPPADQLLARMAELPAASDALVIPLGEHVDYWDQLGWRDRFSSAALTARQQQYARRLRGDGPYTPQLVVDGRAECVGSDAAAARRAIASAAGRPHGSVTIDIASASVNALSNAAALHVAARALNLPQKPEQRADLFVAITEDRLRSDVTRGENRGRTLAHTAVVRQLELAGAAIGQTGSVERTVTLNPGWRRDALHVVVFVQERGTGAVLAAGSVPLVPRQ